MYDFKQIILDEYFFIIVKIILSFSLRESQREERICSRSSRKNRKRSSNRSRSMTYYSNQRRSYDSYNYKEYARERSPPNQSSSSVRLRNISKSFENVPNPPRGNGKYTSYNDQVIADYGSTVTDNKPPTNVDDNNDESLSSEEEDSGKKIIRTFIKNDLEDFSKLFSIT